MSLVVVAEILKLKPVYCTKARQVWQTASTAAFFVAETVHEYKVITQIQANMQTFAYVADVEVL